MRAEELRSLQRLAHGWLAGVQRTNRVFDRTVGREATYDALIASFAGRVERGSSCRDPRALDTLVATAGAPGSGKSHLLDAVITDLPAYARAQYPAQHEGSGAAALVADALSEAVPLLVTYNSWSPYTKEFDALFPVPCLALRALATYLFEFNVGDRWDSLVWWAHGSPHFRSLNLSTALRAVALHSGAENLYLGVDEILRTAPESLGSVLAEIGSALEDFGRRDSAQSNAVLFCLVTSLDSLALLNATHSARTIDWVPLRQIELAHAMELFKGKKGWLEADSVRCLIADCGGHPRTLAVLFEALSDLKRTHGAGLGAVPYRDLASAMCRRLQRYNISDALLSLDVLTPALLGETVALNSHLRDSTGADTRVRDLVALGTYCNSQHETKFSGNVCPTVQPLLVQMWARRVLAEQPGLHKDAHRARAVAKILTDNMFVDPHSAVSASALMEGFHAGWERLVRVLRPQWAAECFELSSHYRGAIAKRAELLHERFRLCVVGSLVPEGTDAVVPVALAIDLSGAGQPATLSPQGIDGTTRGAAAALQGAPGSFLVVAISGRGEAQQRADSREWEGDNVLAVPPESLVSLYGPTLCCRPQLLLSLCGPRAASASSLGQTRP
eukprot:m51a1_g5360 hypothetical protein (617) ;mRNA; r:495688-498107